jgi:anti-sigma B factor antagonist
MDQDRSTEITGLTLDVRPTDDGTVVQLSGEMDVSSTAPLQEFLLRIMRAKGPQLLLDLCGVSFMDCSGLTALIMTQRRAVQRHGRVRLIAVSQHVRTVIELTGVQEVLALPPLARAGAAHT